MLQAICLCSLPTIRLWLCSVTLVMAPALTEGTSSQMDRGNWRRHSPGRSRCSGDPLHSLPLMLNIWLGCLRCYFVLFTPLDEIISEPIALTHAVLQKKIDIKWTKILIRSLRENDDVTRAHCCFTVCDQHPDASPALQQLIRHAASSLCLLSVFAADCLVCHSQHLPLLQTYLMNSEGALRLTSTDRFAALIVSNRSPWTLLPTFTGASKEILT